MVGNCNRAHRVDPCTGATDVGAGPHTVSGGSSCANAPRKNTGDSPRLVAVTLPRGDVDPPVKLTTNLAEGAYMGKAQIAMECL